ncbi:MAG: OmpH family outer membrane protein [Pirellulales bacterium]|nr:OmpH family outer membrane protein [Pirellulales bacterium]
MRTLLLTAIVFGLAATTIPALAQPASPSANASRFGIGVVDVSYVFKKYSRFTTAMDGMKKEMQKAEAELKGERDGIQAKEEEAKRFNESAPEFIKLEEETVRLKADFNIKAGRIRKEFLEREAKVYYQTYMEVIQVVQSYAQQRELGLVLRFNGDPIDPNRREAILQGINKVVVHQNGIDITPDVLALLNRDNAIGNAPTASSRQPVIR